METFLKNLTDPSWWIGVVLLTVFLNLGSAYLKPIIDRLLARWSKQRRNRFAQVQWTESAIEALCNDPTGIKTIRFLVARNRSAMRFYFDLLSSAIFMMGAGIVASLGGDFDLVAIFIIGALALLTLTLRQIPERDVADYIIQEYDRRTAELDSTAPPTTE